MLRVSSRQRLVSWDAFDANAPEGTQVVPMVEEEASPSTAPPASATNAEPMEVLDVDDDYYSVAGYPSSSALAAPSTGWSFDQADQQQPHAVLPGTSSPASPSVAGRKRDREALPAATAMTMPTTTSPSPRNMRKTVSFSTLPQFPALVEEEDNNNNNNHPTAANATSGKNLKPSMAAVAAARPMPRTPSLLDLLHKPSSSPAVVPPIATSSRPTTPAVGTGRRNSQQSATTTKTLVIPRVPSTVGLGSRVASDCSLSSTLSRYMSVPSNLCDIDCHSVMSTTTSNAADYSPSSLSRHSHHQLHHQHQMQHAQQVDQNEEDGKVAHLPGDTLCSVASYLNTADLRHLSTTNADLRVHFAGPSGRHLWVDRAAAHWPSILGGDGNDNDPLDGKIVEIVDKIGIVTAGLGGLNVSSETEQQQQQQQPNLSALVGLAASNCPTSMSPCPMPSASEIPGRQRRIRVGEEFGTVEVDDKSSSKKKAKSKRSAVQFTGIVGEGDRSITSDAPLPRPLPPPSSKVDSSGGQEEGSSANGGNKSKVSKWSPRLSPLGPLSEMPSPTQTLITLLRKASSVGKSNSDDEGEDASSGGADGQGRLRPFVCPYVASENDDRTVIDMTPRLVAYYEVKILPHDSIVQEAGGGQEEAPVGRARPFPPAPRLTLEQHRRALPPPAQGDGPAMPPLLRLPGPALGWGPAGFPGAGGTAFPAPPMPRHLPPPRHPIAAGGGDPNDAPPSDCVAIGLSTSQFRPAAKMPGWDAHSYGYHSDDGGIFHGAGDMERVYGSTYGVGDTVGCGVDYSYGDGGAIFFTLNGKFLGYAWTDVDAIAMGDDLYPTVGVDTNCPLEVNFGTHPFQFDLGEFVESQRDEIESSLGPLVAKREEEEESDEEDCFATSNVNVEREGGGLLFDPKKIEEWGAGVADDMAPFSRGIVAFGGKGVNGTADGGMSRTGTSSGGLRKSRMFRG